MSSLLKSFKKCSACCCCCSCWNSICCCCCCCNFCDMSLCFLASSSSCAFLSSISDGLEFSHRKATVSFPTESSLWFFGWIDHPLLFLWLPNLPWPPLSSLQPSLFEDIFLVKAMVVNFIWSIFSNEIAKLILQPWLSGRNPTGFFFIFILSRVLSASSLYL